MRLDHIAYRVRDRDAAVKFFEKFFGYSIDKELPEGFDIQFEDGTKARCFALKPPEYSEARMVYGMFSQEYHAAPEVFVSEGTDNSIVREWVEKNGSGIHHLAYEVDSVEETMNEWRAKGIEFTTATPLVCPDLVQAFTKPNPITGLIYEIIQRGRFGFCKDNVKDLMNSTKET